MAETFGISPATWERLQATLSEYDAVEKAVLFGSRALGRARKGSDIDLVLWGPRVSTRIALDVAGRLNEREPIPYHVDVLCGNALDNPDLRDHIERVGKVVYQRREGSPGASH